MKKPKVSVVITTKNEEKNIENCLKSIKRQTYKNIEIIVVDNNSEDKTKEIAKKYTKLVFNKGPERSGQRNFGRRRSRGKYVLYLDADMILTPKVVEESVETFIKDEKIAGLYIPEKIIGKGFWIKVRDFERSFYDGTVIDCARFIDRKAFDKVRGFDTAMTGPEDWDFDRKIRNVGKTVLIKSSLLHNEGEFNIKKYLSKKGYYARNFDLYIKKWGINDRDIRKQLGCYYRLLGVFIENGKWKKLFMHPLLALGMYCLRALVGIGFLFRKKDKK